MDGHDPKCATFRTLPLIYLFILISAYKWYMKPLTLKQTWMMTGTGLGFFLLYTCVSVVLSLFGIDKGIFVTGSFKIGRAHV